MSWISEGLERQKIEKARNEAIAASGPSAYETVWQEIDRCITEAAKGGIPAFVGDHRGPHDREVRVSVPAKRGQSSSNPKNLRVKLSDDKHAIEADGDSKSLRLELDLSNNNLCLMHEGKTVSVPEAAQLILEPFFFPGVQRS